MIKIATAAASDKPAKQTKTSSGKSKTKAAPKNAASAGATVTADVVKFSKGVDKVRFADLLPSIDNPRRSIDPAGIAELAESINADGVLQNIIVKPEGDKFRIIAGSRRLAALTILREDGRIDDDYGVPVVVRDVSDEEAFAIATTENVAREDMNPLDECIAVARMASHDKVSINAIARRLGLTPFKVQQRIAVADLEAGAQELLSSGRRPLIWCATLAQIPQARRQQIVEEVLQNDMAFPSADMLRSIIAKATVAVDAALFDVNDSGLAVQTNLLDNQDAFFVDQHEFWKRQNEAIAKLQEDLEREGHDDVQVLRGDFLTLRDYEPNASGTGGTAFIMVSPDGHVTVERHMTRIADAIEAADEEAIFEDVEDTTVSTITETEVTGGAARHLLERRREAAALALIANPRLAKVVAAAAVLGDSRIGHALTAPTAKATETMHTRLKIALDDVAWHRDEAKQSASMLDYAHGLDDGQLDRLVAIGHAFSLPSGGTTGAPFKADALPKELLALAGESVRTHWDPDEAFFQTLTVGQLKTLAAEVLPAADQAGVASSTKNDLARLLTDRFREARSPNNNLDPDTELTLRSWMPSYL